MEGLAADRAAGAYLTFLAAALQLATCPQPSFMGNGVACSTCFLVPQNMVHIQTHWIGALPAKGSACLLSSGCRNPCCFLLQGGHSGATLSPNASFKLIYVESYSAGFYVPPQAGDRDCICFAQFAHWQIERTAPITHMQAGILQETWPLYCTATPPPSPSSSSSATAKCRRDPEHVFDNSPWHSALILCHLTSWHWLSIGRWSQAITLLTRSLGPVHSDFCMGQVIARVQRKKGEGMSILGQNVQMDTASGDERRWSWERKEMRDVFIKDVSWWAW